MAYPATDLTKLRATSHLATSHQIAHWNMPSVCLSMPNTLNCAFINDGAISAWGKTGFARMKKQTIAITGAAGLVGQNLVMLL